MNHFTSRINIPQICSKPLTADFEGGEITSNGGLPTLVLAERGMHLFSSMAACINDARETNKITHGIEEMISQRVLGIACGYEDCNDHNTLRHDAMLKMASGRLPGDDGLASQPTLSRLENGVTNRELLQMGKAMAQCVIARLPADTQKVILDIDDTVDPVYGDQQLGLFNRHYGTVCYCPRLVHLTDEQGNQYLLGGLLRPGTAARKGDRFMLRQAIKMLRAVFPQIQITVRGDAGFGGDPLCRALEHLKVNYIFRFSSNAKLKELANSHFPEALELFLQPPDEQKRETRFYGSFDWKAKKWKAARRMLVKTVVTAGTSFNRFFIVTNRDNDSTLELFNFYHQRGDQENRIKEIKCDLQSGRTSCHRFEANQFRLLLHCAANMIWNTVQRALKIMAPNTMFASAQIGTLQRDLVAIGGRIIERCKHIWLHLSSTCPHQEIYFNLHTYFLSAFG